MRRVIAALVVVGLAIAVIVLWPRSDNGNTSEEATTTTSISTTADPSTTTSSTVVTTSTTSVLEDNVVETVEEAEAILREFLFVWFSAIHDQDEELIRTVVGNPRQVEAAVSQFGKMEFSSRPSRDTIIVNDLEILRSDKQCLATWSDAGAEFRGGTSSSVHTFRWHNGSWVFINTWLLREDQWEQDCESVVKQ